MKIATSEIRRLFLEYFSGHGHRAIDNRSLIPVNDPTLLYINSGMAPLKPLFTGAETPPHKRLCNVQRCIRTNDIDSVGDRHHLTFFEMLGNWSIGEYFKEEAIRMAWEAITEVFGFDTPRIYATVYAGDPALPFVPPDDETRRIWSGILPAERIIPLGADSNFWGPAGVTGPCGPCTEVFFDRGQQYGCGKEGCGPDCSCGRFLEIWNAGVFMQYSLDENKTLSALPFKSVDAGAGLERFAVILQGADSVYATDLLQPVMDQVLAGTTIGPTSRPARIMTDHIRCGLFMTMDGVTPANTGREYVLRRIIRRTLLHAKLSNTPMANLKAAARIARTGLSVFYEGLGGALAAFTDCLERESTTFAKAMERGLKKFDKIVAVSGNTISGDDAFDLYETLGLPLEITAEIARSRGMTVDEARFHVKAEEHRQLSRKKPV